MKNGTTFNTASIKKTASVAIAAVAGFMLKQENIKANAETTCITTPKNSNPWIYRHKPSAVSKMEMS